MRMDIVLFRQMQLSELYTAVYILRDCADFPFHRGAKGWRFSRAGQNRVPQVWSSTRPSGGILNAFRVLSLRPTLQRKKRWKTEQGEMKRWDTQLENGTDCSGFVTTLQFGVQSTGACRSMTYFMLSWCFHTLWNAIMWVSVANWLNWKLLDY